MSLRPLALLGCCLPLCVSAQVTPCPNAAFLYAYRAKPGSETAFEEGYKRHLAWHAKNADSLPWFAWTVIDGPEPGLFVNGTFGNAFAAGDVRVNLSGDITDAAHNVSPHADATYRDAFRLRRDLSSATPIERRSPSPMQKVTWLLVDPEHQGHFEAEMRAMSNGTPLAWTLYERVSGGEQPAYLLVSQLSGWRDLDNPENDATRSLIIRAGKALRTLRSEIWLYRSELSYVPPLESTAPAPTTCGTR